MSRRHGAPDVQDRAGVVVMGEDLRALVGGRQLVVVSNREPYVHHRRRNGVVVERPAGGLVAALHPVLEATSGTWIAWGSGNADFTSTDPAGRIRVPPGAPRYTLRRIRLSPSEVRGFYHGFSNQALWPLCHMALDKVRFRARDWDVYRAVNRRFACAVLEEAREDAVVWVQDYHLCLCPGEVRDARPDAFLMHFWHVPWPVWDVFRVCPQGPALLDALLANDLLAFQHPRHLANFLECAARLGARADPDAGVVEYGGRLTTVRAFPIGVDYHALDQVARSEDCTRWMTMLPQRLRTGKCRLVLGVDRLDYTKGLVERLQAFDLFLRRFPRHRSRVVFVLKCAPSRTQVPAYRDLQERVEAEAARLNAVHGRRGWRPVVYLPRPLPLPALAALYRAADVCVVSSLQDGMNLVAKEFVACQVDQRGVLVLSELAGARDELPWAVGVNPYDVEGMAAALARALTMPASERRERLLRLRRAVEGHDVYAWVEDHLRTALRLLRGRGPVQKASALVGDVTRGASRRPLLGVIVDFDGTLVPLADAPEDAVLPEPVAEVLDRIGRRDGAVVAVLSGRALEDLRRRVGLGGVVYSGNHGLEIAGLGWAWTVPEGPRIREAVAAACGRLAARLAGLPGVTVEDKGLTASVHYQGIPVPMVDHVRVAVLEEVLRADGPRLVVRHGRWTFDIRPAVGWDKGAAARWILRKALGDSWTERACVLYMGDDESDEDAFVALGGDALTAAVGTTSLPTAARYRLRDPAEVQTVLEALAPRKPLRVGALVSRPRL